MDFHDKNLQSRNAPEMNNRESRFARSSLAQRGDAEVWQVEIRQTSANDS
jgi:hypothetical protein